MIINKTTMKTYIITFTFEVDNEGSHLDGKITDEQGNTPGSMETFEMLAISCNLHDVANKWLKLAASKL